MKSYLDLVPICAKVHGRQSRMSVFCIVSAVFLVTAVFGMADMFIRGQIMQEQKESGNWHIGIRGVSDEDAALIASRPEVAVAADYGIFNFRGQEGYTLSGKNVAVCGCGEDMVTEIFGILDTGTFPKNEKEALVTDNARDMLDLEIGEQIDIKTPDGAALPYIVSGFINNTAKLLSDDSYGVILTTGSFRKIAPHGVNDSPSKYSTCLFIQFSDTKNVRREIDDIKEQFGLSDEQVSENLNLLGLLGQSRDSFMMQVYACALILFFLVLIAGVLMIAGSLNSNVVQRTEFFGLVRCIGATPRQVMGLVRREALSWCRSSIPMGVAGGTALNWLLCFILRRLSPEYFSGMPVFGVSYPGIMAGIVVGLLTVLTASRSPARKASKVSPLVAASGNVNYLQPVRRASEITFFKVDTFLGIHHAKAGGKNYILMVGSFSISIILFLSFSVTIDFMKHTLTPLRPWTADLSIIGPENTCSVKSGFIEELNHNPAVKAAYGRMFAYNVPASVNGEERLVDLISYEDRQFGWAEDYLLSGSLEPVQTVNNTGLMVYEAKSGIEPGDTVALHIDGGSAEVEIVGVLSDCPFNDQEGVCRLICSEATFRQLTGERDYTIIDIQLSRKATENDVNEIHRMAGMEYTFSDERMGNGSVRGAYCCYGLFIYGFSVLIALITIFNIVNSIAMSVAARTKEYGVFRAIGLSGRQLAKMIVAEASSYAAAGCVCGSVLGLICNKLLFDRLVSFHWGDKWEMPFAELAIITAIVLFSVTAAVAGPIRRIREMSVVDTISAQ